MFGPTQFKEVYLFKLSNRNTQTVLPEPSPSVDVYDVSSDEDFKLVSSSYKGKSSNTTAMTEGTEEALFDHQDKDVTKEPVSSPSNVRTVRTEQTTVQEESTKLVTDKVNPVRNEERDTHKSSGAQHHPTSRTYTSPRDQADAADALDNATQSTTVLPERNKPQNTPQKTKTTCKAYSNRDQEAVLSVKLKLFCEGSQPQTNHVDVHVHEDISPTFRYHQKEENPRRNAGDYVAKKRHTGQYVPIQSYPKRSTQSESSSNRQSRQGTVNERQAAHDGTAPKENGSVVPGALIIIGIILFLYFLANSSKLPDTNQYKQRY